jgi:MYXO-CTERM domain-containing protein
MNQATGGPLGNVNPLLYTLEQSTVFHDITTGNNMIDCVVGSDPGCMTGTLGYAATKGYDCASGLGSVDVYNLVSTLVSQAPTSTALAAAPTAVTEDMTVNLTATVTAPNPNSSPIGGVVTFAFLTKDQNGQDDLSWTLGTGSVTGGMANQGTATFSGAIPPGLVRPGMQFADVYAMYGGDAAHRPSSSSNVTISFGALNFAISPPSATVAPCGTTAFASNGGVGATSWFLGNDGTCDTSSPAHCSSIDQATGMFTAGPTAGTVVLFALDSDFAEVSATVTVSGAGTCEVGPDGGSATDGGPSTDGASADANADADEGEAGADSGSTLDADASTDAGSGSDAATSGDSALAVMDAAGTENDAGGGTGSSPSSENSGCGCRTARSSSSGREVVVFAALGLAMVSRRRERRRR